jgi:hypothetical protein
MAGSPAAWCTRVACPHSASVVATSGEMSTVAAFLAHAHASPGDAAGRRHGRGERPAPQGAIHRVAAALATREALTVTTGDDPA